MADRVRWYGTAQRERETRSAEGRFSLSDVADSDFFPQAAELLVLLVLWATAARPLNVRFFS
jgi:hypothetical protein